MDGELRGVHHLFVKFSDTPQHVGAIDSCAAVQGLIAFWSHALAACLFASVMVWRLRERVEGPERLLIACYFATALWAIVGAARGAADPQTKPVETQRNQQWIKLLQSIWSGIRDRARGLRFVFGAEALVIGLQMSLNLLVLLVPLPAALTGDVLATERLLRITMSAGALVLVHNLYGQAAPQSRLSIRAPMLGLTLMWGYDLNLYTTAYLGAGGADDLFTWRGAFAALIAPLFALGSAGAKSLRIRLSRAATFQSLSLVAIISYLAVMVVLATALRRSQWDWASAVTVALLATMTLAAGVLVTSQWARGWVKVKLAKHFFEHRYDYRTEWLRFTDTLGRTGADAAPLGDRIVKAFADIADAPGGLLLVSDAGGAIAAAASWNWPGENPPAGELERDASFWSEVESRGRIVEFEALRNGWGDPSDRALPVPAWMIEDVAAWVAIPLIHHERLVGIVLLAAPEYRRPLDWEDFDLLRTAGRQAASSLAEAHGQQALSNAQRFEEFNRRFAFILHDVKNLVSQLSLLSRNAERHADNPEFRSDMIATLKASVGKMNDLLARLSPRSGAGVQKLEPQPLRPVLTAAIAAKRGEHDVRLIGDTSVWAQADGAALEQAVSHLIQNAVEACSPTVPITVKVGSKDSAIAISIADKGVGMDADFVRNRLFQPFASSKPGGFGIGAFEARSLIAAMGGRLGVDSRPGKGTTFTILLPAAEPVSEPLRKSA
jgi:putative PEP-CTERM system histidine kinase